MATTRTWKARQRVLNAWFQRVRLKGFPPLIVDGRPGPATRKRIRQAKWFLGYTKNRGSAYTDKLHHQLLTPYSRKYTSTKSILRGKARRVRHNRLYAKSHRIGGRTTGVGTYDGVRVANWMIPYLQWARAHGWKGRLVSGWRDPNYSQRLCYSMCGAPSCPGRCAGLSSNHVGSVKPRGAVDVTDYYRFGQLMRACPYSPHIFNGLGSRDPVHFSVSGG